MRKLNNESYKKLLKSRKPEYEKKMLWTSIEAELDKKKEKRFLWIFFFGIALATILIWFGWNKIMNEATSQTKIEVVDQTVNQKTDRNISNKKETDGSLTSTIGTALDKKENVKRSSGFESELRNDALIPKETLDLESSDVLFSSNVNNTNSHHPRSNTESIVRHEESEDLNAKSTINDSQLVESEMENSVLKPNVGDTTEIPRIGKGNLSDLPYIEPPFSLSSTQLEPKRTIPFLINYSPINIRSKRVGLRHYLSMECSLSKPTTHFASTDQRGEQWNQSLIQATTDLYHKGLALKYKLQFSSGLELNTGFHIDRIVTRFNHTELTTTIDSIPSDEGQYFVYADGTRGTFPGILERTTKETYSVQHFNHEYRLGLSLGLGYVHGLSRKLSVRSGINGIIFPFVFSDGKTLDSNDLIVSNDLTMAKDLIQLELIGQLCYKSQPGMEWFFGAHYKSDFTSSWTSDLVSRKTNLKGLNLGVRFKL